MRSPKRKNLVSLVLTTLFYFFKNGTSFLPPKMLNSRKKTSNSKQSVLAPIFRHLVHSTMRTIIKFILLLILYLCLLFLNKIQTHRLPKLLSKLHHIWLIIIGSCSTSERIEIKSKSSKRHQIFIVENWLLSTINLMHKFLFPAVNVDASDVIQMWTWFFTDDIASISN